MSMQYPESWDRVSRELSRLPGIGKKTALRLAFGILRYTPEEAANLAEAIRQVKERIHHCDVCHGFTDLRTCSVCSNQMRNQRLICVVEQPLMSSRLSEVGFIRAFIMCCSVLYPHWKGLDLTNCKFEAYASGWKKMVQTS